MQVDAMRALQLMGDVHAAAHNNAGALRYYLSAGLHAAGAHVDTLAAEALLAQGRTWLELAPQQLGEVLLLVQVRCWGAGCM